AVGSGFAANVDHLNSVSQASKHVNAGGHQVSAQAIVSASSTVAKTVPKISKKVDETFGISQPLGRERRWSPTGTVRPVMDDASSGP
ncbi:hypothetical protein SB753_38625, partial [Paraburkholderia sp. SIMBA_053]